MAEWDVIVVGAGSAGAAPAYRLTEDPGRRVLLLRRGRTMFAVIADEAVRSLASSVVLDELGTIPDDLTDDAALDAWLAATVSDYVHAAGTCRMGSVDDAAAVVDPHCRFIGVDGLSIVDASIIPVIPRANTHLTAVMIAERAASFLSAQ